MYHDWAIIKFVVDH